MVAKNKNEVYFESGDFRFGSYDDKKLVNLSHSCSSTNTLQFDKDIYFWKERNRSMFYATYKMHEKNGYWYSPNSDWKNRTTTTLLKDIQIQMDTQYDHDLIERVFLWKGKETSKDVFFENCTSLFNEWEKACFLYLEKTKKRAYQVFLEKGFFNSEVFSGWSSWGVGYFSCTTTICGLTTSIDIKYQVTNDGLSFLPNHNFFSY